MILEEFESIKTTKIAIIGDIEKASQVWVVLHGYGQLVQFFIRKFSSLTKHNIAVIAPEAQSRFYNQGYNGRVGANWMTKEARETDIKDYLNYLNSVYSKYNLSSKDATLLGFSQGGATASRWYSNSPQLFNNLILWSSIFPNDFNFEIKELSSCTLVVGKKDEFLTEDNFKDYVHLEKENSNLKIIYHNDGHDIYPSIFRQLIS